MSAGSGGWLEAFAPAKLNPWLEVLGRRPDGYHELRTVMVALDMGDLVRARRSASGRVELTLGGPAASGDVPTDARNLAARGAALALELAREAGTADAGTGLLVELEKRIPSQAGLGGASSDAAAALLAGAAALGLDLRPGPGAAPSREPHGAAAAAEPGPGPAPESALELAEIWPRARAGLARLGSDCSFFLEARSGAALCLGRGERIEPLAAPRPPWEVALVAPAVPAPTAEVYAALEQLPPRSPRRVPGFAGRRVPAAGDPALGPFHNALEAACLRAVPALGPWRALLDEAAPGAFHLSGSGSSFFAVHAAPRDATEALAAVLGAARARGLRTRGAWVLRTASAAARLSGPASDS